MRSIVLLILAATALCAGADACCGGGGLDGVDGPKMMNNICPSDNIILKPRMTYEEDGRYGVAVIIDPSGKASMAFTGGEDGRELENPVHGGRMGNLPINQAAIAHLNEVQMNFNAYRETWEANRWFA